MAPIRDSRSRNAIPPIVHCRSSATKKAAEVIAYNYSDWLGLPTTVMKSRPNQGARTDGTVGALAQQADGADSAARWGLT
jgi:hypothetical protein